MAQNLQHEPKETSMLHIVGVEEMGLPVPRPRTRPLVGAIQDESMPSGSCQLQASLENLCRRAQDYLSHTSPPQIL